MTGLTEDRAIHAQELEGLKYEEIKLHCLDRIWNDYEKEIEPVKMQFLPFEKLLSCVILIETGSNILTAWIN